MSTSPNPDAAMKLVLDEVWLDHAGCPSNVMSYYDLSRMLHWKGHLMSIQFMRVRLCTQAAMQAGRDAW